MGQVLPRAVRWALLVLILSLAAYEAFPLMVMSGDVVHGRPHGYDVAVLVAVAKIICVVLAAFRPRVAWMVLVVGLLDWALTAVVFHDNQQRNEGGVPGSNSLDIVFLLLVAGYWGVAGRRAT